MCTVWSALGTSVSCDVSLSTRLTLKLSPVSITVSPFRQNRLSAFVKEQLVVRVSPSLTVRGPGEVVNSATAGHTGRCLYGVYSIIQKEYSWCSPEMKQQLAVMRKSRVNASELTGVLRIVLWELSQVPTRADHQNNDVELKNSRAHDSTTNHTTVCNYSAGGSKFNSLAHQNSI